MSSEDWKHCCDQNRFGVIGASMKPNGAGFLIMRNLLAEALTDGTPGDAAWKAVLGVFLAGYCPLAYTRPSGFMYQCRRNLALLEELGEKGCKTSLFFPPRHRNTKYPAPAPAP
ncbi:hypothetical protein ACNKHM_20185 [Shigella sonnei]